MEGTKKIILLMAIDSDFELSMEMLEDSEDIFNNPTDSTQDSIDQDQDMITPEEALGLPEEKLTEDNIDSNDAFDIDNPESGGEEDDINNVSSTLGKDPITTIKDSPPLNISSILSALKEDGILPDVDDKIIQTAKTAEDFASIIDQQVSARLSDQEKRIKAALDGGIAPQVINEFDQTLNYLNSIDDNLLEDEGEDGENLRQTLIYQDYINRGFKPERAKKEVDKSIAAGTDIEDAKNALDGNKEFYQERYNEILANTQKERDAILNQQKQEAEKFQKRVLDTEEPFEGIKLDQRTRKQVFETATKLIDKGDDGQIRTALQKYIQDNPMEAQYYVSLFYTLTNGFKDIDKLIGSKVKSATKKTFSNLEKTLSNTSSFGDSGASLFEEDPDKTFIRLDL